MYYPYLRGRGEELNAIIATTKLLGTNGRIIPVIEPVRNGYRSLGALKKCATACGSTDVTVGFIINPVVGDFSTNQTELIPYLRLIKSLCNVIPFFIIQKTTILGEITGFLAANNSGQVGFIHYNEPAANNKQIISSLSSKSTRTTHLFMDGGCSIAYISAITSTNRVLVRDGFIRRNRNADYPDRKPEFFSNLHITYKSMGYDGFSDFLTIGIDYVEADYAPRAIALHLTNYNKKMILCTHFVSTSNQNISNRDRKYREALDSLYAFNQAYPATFHNSVAVSEFINDRINGTSTSLGMMKRRSIRHHLEMMCKIV